MFCVDFSFFNQKSKCCLKKCKIVQKFKCFDQKSRCVAEKLRLLHITCDLSVGFIILHHIMPNIALRNPFLIKY